MEDVEINYKTLRKIQEFEKKTPGLTELRPNFYDMLNNYLNDIDDALKNESSDKKQALFSEEVANIKKIAINIYEQREKKVILAAIARIRGGKPDISKMLDVEKDLFDSIINIMQSSRKIFLEGKKQPLEKPVITKKKDDEKENIKPCEEPSQDTDESEVNTNPVLRITENIPEFIGTDEKRYHLRNNDVLSMPEDMSEMLINRGVAKKVNNNY